MTLSDTLKFIMLTSVEICNKITIFKQFRFKILRSLINPLVNLNWLVPIKLCPIKQIYQENIWVLAIMSYLRLLR